MKKILILAPMISGHLQKWIRDLDNEFEFHIFTLHVGGDNLPNSTIYSFPSITKTRFDFFLSFFYLQYLIYKLKPNLIHAHFFSSYGFLAALSVTKVKKILSVWGTDINGKVSKSKFMNLIAKYLINKFDWINAPAQHLKEKIILLGGDPNKIDVFQYGLNTNIPVKNVDSPLGCINIASLRNWDSLYHIEDILVGYKSFIINSDFQTKLFVFGKGDSDTDIKIKKLIDDLDFPHGSIEVVGFIKHEELIDMLLRFDISISIPEMDGTPLSLLESMYIGLYPIVSNIDANREWLNDDSATFIESYSAMHISQAIEQACSIYYQNKFNTEINRNLVKEKASYICNVNKLRVKYKSYLGVI